MILPQVFCVFVRKIPRRVNSKLIEEFRFVGGGRDVLKRRHWIIDIKYKLDYTEKPDVKKKTEENRERDYLF